MTSSAARDAYLPPQYGQLMPKCGIISRLFDLNRNQIEVSCDLIDVDRIRRPDGSVRSYSCRCRRPYDARCWARQRRLHVAFPRNGRAWRGCAFRPGKTLAAAGWLRARRMGFWQCPVLQRHHLASLCWTPSVRNGGSDRGRHFNWRLARTRGCRHWHHDATSRRLRRSPRLIVIFIFLSELHAERHRRP